MTVAEELRGAARILRERGHVQRTFVGDNGEVCLVQALALAAGHLAPMSPTAGGKALAAAEGLSNMDRLSPLCEFNNTHTTEQVLSALDRAADKVMA